jgi:ATP-binding cassette, subfamily B, bacterial
MPRLQRMSLRFFTNTKVGELMSRLNNDVVGAQNAISSTIVGIITNIGPGGCRAGGDADARVAPDTDQRGDPAAVYRGGAPLGTRLRDMAREQMEANAQMNAMMNETLNIGGALLVKLFGRRQLEIERFGQRRAGARPGH